MVKPGTSAILKLLVIAFFNALAMILFFIILLGVPALALWLLHLALSGLGLNDNENVLMVIYPIAVIAMIAVWFFLQNRSNPEVAKKLVQAGRYEEARKVLEKELAKSRIHIDAMKIMADLDFKGLGGDVNLDNAARLYGNLLIHDTIGQLRVFGRTQEPSFQMAEDVQVSES